MKLQIKKVLWSLHKLESLSEAVLWMVQKNLVSHAYFRVVQKNIVSQKCHPPTQGLMNAP